MKSLSTGLLLLGVIWALLVVWMFLALMGITDPISAMRVVLYFVVLLLGPLLLIAGPILVLSGRHPKAGAILAMVGCIILTITVAYQVPSLLRDRHDPLIMKSPWGLYAVPIILTLLADAGAVQLYRLAGRPSRAA
jgi:hypothetical protein